MILQNSKLNKLKQGFNSLDQDYNTKFSLNNEHQEEMEEQVDTIHQGIQEMGNKMNSINQGMQYLSSHHDSLCNQFETEFEKVYKQFGSVNLEFGKLNKEFDDMSTDIQQIKGNQSLLDHNHRVLQHKVTLEINHRQQKNRQDSLNDTRWTILLIQSTESRTCRNCKVKRLKLCMLVGILVMMQQCNMMTSPASKD
jgi:predicted  nucleic acid-binding Zn-ribbon protein